MKRLCSLRQKHSEEFNTFFSGPRWMWYHPHVFPSSAWSLHFSFPEHPQGVHSFPRGCFFVAVQLLSHVWLSATPWTAAHQVPLPSRGFRSLLKLASIESVMLSNNLTLCCPFSCAFNLSQRRGFSNESSLCIRWLKYWSFSFSISPSNEYSGLISSRTDLLSKGLSGVFSSGTMILKHQLFGALPSWWSTSQNRAWLLEKP